MVVIAGNQEAPAGSGLAVEVYWPSNNSFTVGPQLPLEIDEAAVVQADGSFLLVGGIQYPEPCCPEESADILRFDYDGWKWEVNSRNLNLILYNSESHYFLYLGDGTKAESTSARTCRVRPRGDATARTLR